MLLFLVIVLAVGIFYYFNIKRGKRFVRAYAYILHYDDSMERGERKAEAQQYANSIALKLTLTKLSDPEMDNFTIRQAKAYAADYFNGKQLPVIDKARSMGFLG